MQVDEVRSMVFGCQFKRINATEKVERKESSEMSALPSLLAAPTCTQSHWHLLASRPFYRLVDGACCLGSVPLPPTPFSTLGSLEYIHRSPHIVQSPCRAQIKHESYLHSWLAMAVDRTRHKRSYRILPLHAFVDAPNHDSEVKLRHHNQVVCE